MIGLLTGTLAEYHPFRTHLPELSLYNLNILGKMGFGALGGFEYMAILAGETKAPARSVTRSVFIAAPVIALMFVLGDERGRGLRAERRHRSDRPGGASAAGRLRAVRHRDADRDGGDSDDAGDACRRRRASPSPR